MSIFMVMQEIKSGNLQSQPPKVHPLGLYMVILFNTVWTKVVDQPTNNRQTDSATAEPRHKSVKMGYMKRQKPERNQKNVSDSNCILHQDSI